MTPDYVAHTERINNILTEDFIRNNYNNINLENAINNLINNFNTHRIINHPIEQIVTRKVPRGVPIVDGYVFSGWDVNPPIVSGRLVNDSPSFFVPEGEVSEGNPIVVGRPIFPAWAFDVCVIGGRRI